MLQWRKVSVMSLLLGSFLIISCGEDERAGLPPSQSLEGHWMLTRIQGNVEGRPYTNTFDENSTDFFLLALVSGKGRLTQVQNSTGSHYCLHAQDYSIEGNSKITIQKLGLSCEGIEFVIHSFDGSSFSYVQQSNAITLSRIESSKYEAILARLGLAK